MDTENKKTNMVVKVDKSVRDQLAGVALLKKKKFPEVLQSAMEYYIKQFEKEKK